MASQSSLRARVATIRELLAPDTTRQPCSAVRIVYESPPAQGPLLLTAGDGPAAEAPSPAEPDAARKRGDGHVCSERCVRWTIVYPAIPERDSASTEDSGADAVGAHSGSGRGDVQRLPESAAAGRDVEPESDPPRSPAPAYGPEEGAGDVLLGGRASDAVVEVKRGVVSVPLGALPPQLGPEDVVEGDEPHGPCALPFCRHPLQAHRCYTDQLPCRYCNWLVGDHNGFDPGLAYASRRALPCGVYRAINFDGGEQDGCAIDGCGCPGWRLKAPYMTDYEAALRLRIVEQDQIIAANAKELARLRTEYETRQRDAFRAQGTNDLGASPRTCPIFSEGETA